MKSRPNGTDGPYLVLLQARSLLSGDLSDAGAAERVLRDRRDARPALDLLRRAGRRVPADRRRGTRDDGDRGCAEPLADLPDAAADNPLDQGGARHRDLDPRLVCRDHAAAQPDQARPLDPDPRRRAPDDGRRDLLHRPALVLVLPDLELGA